MVTTKRECPSTLVNYGDICGPGGSGAFISYEESLSTGVAITNMWLCKLSHFFYARLEYLPNLVLEIKRKVKISPSFCS